MCTILMQILMKQGRRLYTCQLELIIYNIYIHLLSDRAMDAHYCVRCVVFPQEASRNHASDIGDRVALRGGALRGDDGVEDSHVPPRLQASDEAKGDPRFQARIHLHGHRLREAGESHGGPESQRTREDPSVALQKLSPRRAHGSTPSNIANKPCIGQQADAAIVAGGSRRRGADDGSSDARQNARDILISCQMHDESPYASFRRPF